MIALYRWRPMAAGDLPGVLALADAIHPDLPESEAVIAGRRRLHPAGCHVLSPAPASSASPSGAGTANGAGAPIAGYTIAHPWRGHAPPKLDQPVARLPDEADSFYIHDVALSPIVRGRGHADAVVLSLLEHATLSGFRSAFLVSVYGTGRFWARFGLTDETRNAPAGSLAGYGADARLMVRLLTE